MQSIGSIIKKMPIPDLFLVRTDLKGKVEPLEKYWEPCPRCQSETRIPVWTYQQDGETKRHAPDEICTVCKNGGSSYNSQEHKESAVSKKWYHVLEDDPSGFKTYETHNGATDKALKEAKDYTKIILGGKRNLNLLLMGSTGTGKTHLAKTIAKNAKAKGLKVAYVPAADLFEMIKETFGHERHKKKFWDEYADFDLVIIDDVGLETKKIGEVNWTVTEWTKLLDARESKATVYTTNFDDLSLKTVVGERAYSRMYMNTRFIDLFTDDYRKNFSK